MAEPPASSGALQSQDQGLDLIDLTDFDEEDSGIQPAAAESATNCSPSQPRMQPRLPKRPRYGQSYEAQAQDEACPICFEMWTSHGEHRLSSLQCGHLFGKSCILKFFSSGGDRCPLCNRASETSDIRTLFAPNTLVAQDTEELETLKRKLDSETYRMKEAQRTLQQAQQSYAVLMKQTSALQKKIDKLQKERQLSQQAGQLHVSCESIKQLQDVVKSQSVPMSPHGSFAFSSRIPLSYGKNRCCLFGARAARLVASGYSPSTTPFFRNGSHGLVQMDLSAPQSSDFLKLHGDGIRDVRLCPSNEALVLTASLDKTLKVSSLTDQICVHSFSLPSPCWSCSWDASDPFCVYAGLANNDIWCLDIRNPQLPVTTLTSSHRYPIVALHSVESSGGPKGLLAAGLKDIAFWKLDGGDPIAHDFPHLQGSLMYATPLCLDNRCLLSYRPSGSSKLSQHLLVKFSLSAEQPVAAIERVIMDSCICAGSLSEQLLARSLLFQVDQSLLACTSNQNSVSAQLWDVVSGRMFQELNKQSSQIPFVDFTLVPGETPLLAALSDGRVDVFAYSPPS